METSMTGTGETGNYAAFLAGKRLVATAVGFAPTPFEMAPATAAKQLFDWQRDLVRWAVIRGRAALFCDTGLGKTGMQVSWARAVTMRTKFPVLILAPLAVAEQTVREGRMFGESVTHCRSQADICADGINVTNYERLHRFDPAAFAGVVLDESGILKAYDGKTRTAIIEAFARTPYRLACTATPAPNDYMELGNHAEFLGVMTRSEMLSTFFVHDGGETQTWRLKGHAEDEFWRWVSSWAAVLRTPADLGYADAGYNLPPLTTQAHRIDGGGAIPEGMLFAVEARTLDERRRARRASAPGRVADCAALIAASSEQWVCWCDYNAEQEALTRALGADCVSIAGTTPPDARVAMEARWRAGEVKILISKPVLFGWGMNWQHCAHMAFVGLSDSYEMYYQAIRRCWRYGQTRPVDVHLFFGEAETAVLRNLERKAADAERMYTGMIAHMRDFTRAAVRSTTRDTAIYRPTTPMILPGWLRGEAA